MAYHRDNAVLITGFGTPSKCLATVTLGEQYILSVNVEGTDISLWYDDISSPAILHSANSVLSRHKRNVTCESIMLIL